MIYLCGNISGVHFYSPCALMIFVLYIKACLTFLCHCCTLFTLHGCDKTKNTEHQVMLFVINLF